MNVGRYPDGDPRWPCWLSLEKALVLVEPELLPRVLEVGYELRRNEGEALGGLVLERVTATHANPRPGLPNVVDLWIEPGTRLVRRMELCFPADERLPEGDAFLDRPSFAFEHPLSASGLRPHAMTLELLERPHFPDTWFQPRPDVR
jgi:hypothetical protein